VSKQSNRLSSSSSHDGQAEGTSQQSRQSHLPHWPGPDLGHEEVNPAAADTASEESCRRGAHRAGAAGTRPQIPEVHEQRPSESTSVTFVTCQGRRFGG
jgi:hypothetical protein